MLDTPHRDPPHAIETEQAVLGKILVDNLAMDALAQLTGEDFYDPIHAAIFSAMQTQWQESRSINLGTLRSILVELPNITERVNPFEYIRRLMGFGDTRNVAALGNELVSYTNRRRLCAVAYDIEARARNLGASIAETASLGVSGMDVVLSHARKGQSTRSTVEDAFKAAADAILQGDSTDRITTGLRDVDALLGGWRRRQLQILAGRPSMGKTAVATSSMLRTARAGIGVLYFSLEMPTSALATRCLTDLAWSGADDDGIAYSRALSNSLTAREVDLIGRVAAQWSSLPITIDDQRGLTVAEIAARARAEAQRFEQAGKRLGLVVVDHLGLIRPSGRYAGNKVQEVGEVSDALATLAKDQDVAVLALHQLNRNTEARDNKRPALADLRDSGNLEQDADVVCFAYREAYYLERQKGDAGSEPDRKRQEDLDACRNSLEILIAKNRNGPTTSVTLYCDMPSNVVRDLARGARSA